MTRPIEPFCTMCGHPVNGDITKWTHVEEARDAGHVPTVYDAAVRPVEPETRQMGTRRPLRG